MMNNDDNDVDEVFKHIIQCCTMKMMGKSIWKIANEKNESEWEWEATRKRESWMYSYKNRATDVKDETGREELRDNVSVF